MTRIVIVSDIRFYREALAGVLARRAGIDVVDVVGDVRAAVASIREHAPDVVLVSVSDGFGPPLTAAMQRVHPRCRVVAIAGPDDERDVLSWIEAGVSGYVTRHESLAELVTMIASVADGMDSCSPRVTAALMHRVAAVKRDRARDLETVALTSREAEILALIDHGLSNKEIAACLTIEVATVKNHVHSILRKLGVGRRQHAAARLHTPPSSAPIVAEDAT